MSTAYFRLRLIKKRLRKKNCTDPLKNHSYSNDNESTKCRICFKDGEICITKHAQVVELSDMISRLCDIDLSNDHKVPKHLCDGCYSFLQQAINFRNTAKLSELSLNQCVGTNSPALSVSETCTKAESPKVLRKINNSIESDSNKYKKQKNVRVQCSICLRLVTSSLYKRHLLRHTSSIHLVCDVCGKLYRKDNLIRHLKLHNFELPFHCHICPYRGRFMESLVIHMRTHSGEKPFPCNKCELRFLTRSNLNRHLLTHKKDRPYKCTECWRGFNSKGDIEIHMRCDHAGIKDFGCRMCGTKYGTKKSLMRHELRVHKREKMAKGRVPLYLQAEYRK